LVNLGVLLHCAAAPWPIGGANDAAQKQTNVFMVGQVHGGFFEGLAKTKKEKLVTCEEMSFSVPHFFLEDLFWQLFLYNFIVTSLENR